MFVVIPLSSAYVCDETTAPPVHFDGSVRVRS
jgi:hypothetical protein